MARKASPRPITQFTPKPKGRPPEHRPTDQSRLKVLVATGMGASVAEAALEMRMEERSLRRHYAAELAEGRARFATKLRIGAGIQALRGDRTMQIFLLKTICGFREPAPERPADAPAEVLTVRIIGGLPD